MFFILTNNAFAIEINVKAKSAILMDENTGTIMYSLNEHEKMPMASMEMESLTRTVVVHIILESRCRLARTVQLCLIFIFRIKSINFMRSFRLTMSAYLFG